MANKRAIVLKSIMAAILTALIITNGIVGTAKAAEIPKTELQPEYITKVLDKNNITEINIDIKQSDWDWLLKNATKKESRSCNITINGTTFYNVGIRPKGNSSLTTIANDSTTDRFSFKLDFGEYVEGQTCFGLRKISLNNIFSDKTYMKEYLSFEMFEFMGVASPAYAYTNIKLNGKAWGFYLAVEGMEESFIQRQFGSTEGNLYKPESIEMAGSQGGMPNFMGRGEGGAPNFMPGGEGGRQNPPDQQRGEGADARAQGGMNGPMGMGNSKGADLKYNGDSPSKYSSVRDGSVFKTTSDSDFNKVIEMIRNLNTGTNLEKYLDVDEILRYFAVNTFLVNMDSYAGGMAHNYYLYEKNGVFQILPWDLNMSFGGFNVSDGSKAVNFPIDKPTTASLENVPLIGKLLEVPKYKERYHKYLEEITDKYVGTGIYENTIVKVDKLIDGYVKGDASSFYSYEEYKKALPVMMTFGKDRAASVSAQLKGEQPSTDYGTFATTVDISVLGGMDMRGPMGGQGGPGGGMGAMPAMGEMPSPENFQKIMAIMQEANGKELTDQQKKELKELGVTEEMLNFMKNMGNGGGFPAMGNMQGMGSMPGMNSIKQAGIIVISIICLLGGLLFTFKFKRRRFTAL